MTTCRVCHRNLSDPESVRLGIGPICRAHGYLESDLPKREEFSDALDDQRPFREALVMQRRITDSGHSKEVTVITNVPHLVVHHSPDGYEFGYGGSGPADLALNACQLYLNITGYQGHKIKCFDGICWKLAWMLHLEFKRAFVENAPRAGTVIPFEQIDAWMKRAITGELLEQCAEREMETE